MRYIGVLLLLISLSGCDLPHTGPYKIRLVILGKMKAKNLAAATAHFGTFLAGKQLVIDTLLLDMPPEAHYPPRNRYRADSILHFLKPKLDNYDVLMAVTDLPISTTAHGHNDYGICGLSYRGGNVSVTSSYHLDKEMFLQTIRHEWGHAALGIVHCHHSNCLMNAANGKAENLRGHANFEENCGRTYASFCHTLR